LKVTGRKKMELDFKFIQENCKTIQDLKDWIKQVEETNETENLQKQADENLTNCLRDLK
jgi:hypothetical protein